jgi:hypothetical protein
VDEQTLAELFDAAKRDVARAHGLSERDAHRLVGSTIGELHADATAMANELGVRDPTLRARDDAGRFSGDMNARIRAAAGR